MPTTVIVSAATPQLLTLKLIESGALVLQESGTTPAPGVVWSYMGQFDVGATGMLHLDDTVNNADAVLGNLQGMLNLTGAPIRVMMGGDLPAVPDSVDNVQIRLAMQAVPYGAGTLLDAVEAAVSQADRVTQIWWHEALRFVVTDLRVQGMAKALGVSDEQLLALWERAKAE